MTEKQARVGAIATAKHERIKIAVVFNPYSEEPDDYGYWPREAFHIFEENSVLIATVDADGTTTEEK